MTKGRAFAIHLTASAAVVLILFGIMRLVWYPAPYFDINGGWTVLRILAGVDVVLGPILTLIAFKPGKPSLRFDMSVIVSLQLAALVYGGSLIYQQRPAFTVFAVDRFTAIPAADVEFDRIRYPELKRLIGIGPLLAEALPPEDPEERRKVMFAVVMDGAKDLEYRAELYRPYRPDLEPLSRRGLDIARLAAQDDETERGLTRLLERLGGAAGDYLYLPLRGQHRDIILVLSRADGQPAGWIDSDPWP
ncbi:TfpX/TfpZ family type IV pilin accessory protein [Thiocystis violacea]|uniref:TfpX/TfpZ family type IV pilin accessory protein n=1 Tax=Thiocystis violacea TaxID=13725 RepID=UPI0019063D15|nr:TfpX/TfpZ family type IV pilin accessory protein [Thiocystis violacea]